MTDKNNGGNEPPQDENQIIAERRAKLGKLREGGAQAFPNDFRRQHLAADLHAEHGAKTKEDLAGRDARSRSWLAAACC
jgi:lysyl-tRNA synthetase class 2